MHSTVLSTMLQRCRLRSGMGTCLQKIQVNLQMPSVAAWLSGSALVSINEVTLRWALLALGWVTDCGRVNHLIL